MRYACSDADEQGPRFTLPGWEKPVHDHEGDRPHGTIDVVQALAVSCNVYFAQLALSLGREPFLALRADGVELGYQGARAPFEPGPGGSRALASTGFGQGAMALSVLQAARLVALIGGGGVQRRCPPTMEKGGVCEERPIVADPERLRPILAGMRRVMTAGTGRRLDAPDGVRVYGKTGTADARGFRGEEPFGIAPAAPARPHSWFVAIAEPESSPACEVTAPGRLALAVVITRGGTGASAAGPAAMEILAAARELGYLGGAP
jgi:peptidoglycan glycosyltransferase